MKNHKDHRGSSGEERQRWHEWGVSEVIGVVLLLSLVVVGGTIVGTQLLSQPAPKEIPNVNFLANYEPGNLTLYHTGGDTLPNGDYKFVVQYEDGRTENFTRPDWSSGKSLTYPAISQPAKVTLVYTGKGAGETALRSVVIGDMGKNYQGPSSESNTTVTVTPTATGTVTITPTVTETVTITPTVTETVTVTPTVTETAPAHYTITPIFDALRGNITCNGTHLVNNTPFEVDAGDTPTLEFLYSTGFKFDNALISGDRGASIPVTASPYTFTTGIDQNYTVTANFSEVAPPVPAHYTITPIFDALRGNITCNGTHLVNNTPFEVSAGDTPTLIFTNLTAGFRFDSALIIGDRDGAATTVTGSPYTFNSPIDRNYTVDANFTVAMFTINATVGPLGSITGSGLRSYPYHSTPSFNVSAIPGYHIASIIVDGVSLAPAQNYTFSPLEADHTITADFAKNVYTINATAGEGGTIAPEGNVLVEFGENQTFTITPGEGNSIDDVIVDGISIGQTASVTFNQVNGNHTIEAFFTINGVGPYSIAGYIWNDQNNNGIWDSGEPPLAGWTVQAMGKGTAQNWFLVNQSTSDSTGYYIINYLPKDHYHVVQVQHPGWDQTWPTKHEGYYVDNLNQGRDDKHQHVTDRSFGNHMTATAGNQILLNNPMNIGVMKDGSYIRFTGTSWREWPQPSHTDDFIQMASSATLSPGLDIDSEGKIRIPWQTEVTIMMNGDQANGQIYISDTRISTFEFDNVKVYFNGNLAATGKITGIWVNGYTNWQSTLTYVMGSYNSGAQFVVDGNNIVNPPWWPYQDWGVNVYGISPQSAPYSNVLNFNYKDGKTYLVCSGSYDLFTA